MFFRVSSLAILCAVFSTAGWSAENGPITNITLSSGGLAEIVRKADVDQSGLITMTVPLDQVNDVLKSIVVFDEKGVVEGITLPGPNPLAETFKNLPFSAEDLQSPASLLAKLQGTRVRLEKSGTIVEGLVLGVTMRNLGQEGQVSVVSVLSDGSIIGVDLEPDTIINFLDSDIEQKVSRALSVVGNGKSDGARTVSLKVAGEGSREISVSYVVPTPIWKTAYRVVTLPDDKARLQAWAVLENASGEDWDDVRITLSSGAPVTLKQRLHDLYWKQRPEVPVDVSAGYVPRVDSGARPELEAFADEARLRKGMTLGAAMPAPAPMPAAEMAQAQVGEAVEGAVAATFTLPRSIDLASGDTLSAPIVDAVVSAETVSVYQPESGEPHPIAAIMIANETDTSLPRGILTVYDGREGYVGDARIDGMPAGEQRMASFATDRKVSVSRETQPTNQITSVKVVKGVLTASVREQSVTGYAVQGAPDDDRTVIIEHPRRQGWRFSSPARMDTTETHHRLRLEVPKGEVVRTTAAEERTLEEAYELISSSEAQLLVLANRMPDEATAEKLRRLGELKAEAAQIDLQIRRIREQKIEGTSDQQRLRANLAALTPGADLYKRSLQKLDQSESRIEDLDRLSATLHESQAQVRKRLWDAIGAL